MEPLTIIILVALALSIFNQIAFMKFADVKKIRKLREELNRDKKEIKNLEPASEEYLKFQKKMMEKSMNMAKLSMRPSMYTIIPFWLIFAYLKNTFDGVGVLVNIPESIPLIGGGLGWLGMYILSSLIFSLVLRKVFESYFWGE